METWRNVARARSGSGRERDGAMNLNVRSMWLVEALLAHAEERRVAAHPVEGGGRIVDCGIDVRGGLLAGLDLARGCLAGLAEGAIVPGEAAGGPAPAV